MLPKSFKKDLSKACKDDFINLTLSSNIELKQDKHPLKGDLKYFEAMLKYAWVLFNAV